MSHHRLTTFTPLLLLLLSGLLSSQTVAAAKLGDIEFPEHTTVGGQTLQLNGTGWRLATFFSIKVYAMGLYLAERSHNPTAIIKAPGNKKIVMHFVREVDADKLSEAWQEGFEKNAENLAAVQTRLDAFKQAMTDVEEGQRMEIAFSGPRTILSLDGKTLLALEGSDFQQALLSVWLGPEPPNDEIKAGILGDASE